MPTLKKLFIKEITTFNILLICSPPCLLFWICCVKISKLIKIKI